MSEVTFELHGRHAEFDTRPCRVLMHDPRDGVALKLLPEASLEKQNFLERPDPALFIA